MDNLLYIVDGHVLIYRAYYAFMKRPLITAKGENISALYGFMRMILKFINDKKPDYLVFVFDSKEKTFRHKIYPQYKAKRLKPPSDLLAQVEIIKTLVEKLGLSKIEVSGYEADDVIGTIAEKALKYGMKSIIISSDKDVLQLVNDNITVYANKKGISEVDILDGEKVLDIWGVPPERIVDLLALMGDQSDNVPGVRGIGQTGAVKLIQKFGSLEDLYNNLERLDNERIKRILEEGRNDAFSSKELVTIKKDAPVNFILETFLMKDFPKEDGITLLMEKELNSIVDELKGVSLTEKKKEEKRGKYYLIERREDFQKLKERIKNKGMMAFDTESTDLDPLKAEIIGASISLEEGEGYYIPIISKTGNAFGRDFLVSDLKAILEDKNIKKIGQNIKYDFAILLKYGIFMDGIIGDTMVASYLLNPQKQRYNLDALAKEYLDYTTIKYKDIVKEDGETLLDYPLGDIVEYACEDSDITLRLYNILEKRLEEENLLALYKDVEMPLVTVLGKMEKTGVKIDSDYLKRMSFKFGEEISDIEEEIYHLAGERFNVRSTKQLSSVLYEKMKLPVIKRTKTGISTDVSVLNELSHIYEIARYLLRHRTLTKLKSTYIDALPSMINAGTGRIHTSFNQTITTTGRLSSTSPNLQNIPIREKEGKAIRGAFIPEKSWFLVSADYSQIELRILASLSSDNAMINTFRNDGDIHSETASMLFGIDVDDVHEDQRQVAKTINYSIIYGMSAFGLSKRLGIPRKEAQEFIDMYFQKYSGVRDYFETIVENAKKDGYVETLLARKRYVPEINSGNRNIFEGARRIAINTPIQGTAADLIKKAMILIDREITKRRMRCRMLIQVHDELVFESPEDDLNALKEIVKEKMENAIIFNVPLKVNISTGKTWEEAH